MARAAQGQLLSRAAHLSRVVALLGSDRLTAERSRVDGATGDEPEPPDEERTPEALRLHWRHCLVCLEVLRVLFEVSDQQTQEDDSEDHSSDHERRMIHVIIPICQIANHSDLLEIL